MPVSFLTAAQRESYGHFAGTLTADELGRYFHLDDDDRKLIAQKVLLPGASLLERFVAKLRSRVEARLWRILGKAITPEGRSRLEDLLRVPEGGRNSWLDRLRRGPVRVSAPALVRAIARLQSV